MNWTTQAEHKSRPGRYTRRSFPFLNPTFELFFLLEEETELFEPVEELDFAELLDLAEDFPLVEDFTELPEELSPLEAGASSDFAELEGRSPTASGKTDEESSPQAVRLIVAIRADTIRAGRYFIKL